MNAKLERTQTVFSFPTEILNAFLVIYWVLYDKNINETDHQILVSHMCTSISFSKKLANIFQNLSGLLSTDWKYSSKPFESIFKWKW